MQEFWARENLLQAKFVLVKLCTTSFVKLGANEILSTYYQRNGMFLKIRANQIRTSEIHARYNVYVKEAKNCSTSANQELEYENCIVFLHKNSMNLLIAEIGNNFNHLK